MKRILIVLGVLLLVLFGWRLYSHLSKRADDRRPGGMPVAVEVAPVALTSLEDAARFSGSLKARSGYTVAPKIGGRLERLYVGIGDAVKNGQLIAELDDGLIQQELEQARADLAVAQAQLEQARVALRAADNDWEAAKSLRERNFTSAADYEKAESDHAAAQAKVSIAQADVQSAQATVKTAEIRLSYTRIRASWSGGGAVRMVGEKLADEGDMLSVNAPILTLVDTGSVTAEIDVIERDYARVKIGQKALVETDSHPGEQFTGSLSRLAPVLSEDSRQARAEIDIPNPDGRLRPGMFARVRIVFARHDSVTAVPVAALTRKDGKSGVFLIDRSAMTARFVPVETGIRDDRFVEVLSPPLQGEVVVLGQEQLRDGGKIRLPEAPGKDAGKTRGGARP